MPKSLLIVESPAKARTLKRYLGDDFLVEASVGHIKDLPKNELGVDVDNGFAPKYGVIRGKGKVIQQLKKAALIADVIYLAPDPDREGEAIAWHVAEEIRPKRGAPKPMYRVMIHEITQKGVREALAHPGVIDANRYNAQQARRILDRLVGYQISPILWDKVRRGLSAGRVQSVALRLVVERERAVVAFQPEEYWTLDARLEGSAPPPFTARLRRVAGKAAQMPGQEAAAALAARAREGEFRLAKVERKEKKRHPAPPFITSTLQREAFRKLRFSAKKTMTLAQRLYEGVDVAGQPVGLITYMRTDSTRLSADAVAACREFIGQRYGQVYLPAKPLVYQAKKNAQDAHEAVRPTAMEYTPERVKGSLENDQFALYQLIWDRFVSCQMKPALFDQTSFDVASGDLTFRATGSILTFKGFMAVYVEGADEINPEAAEEEGKVLPDLVEGEVLKLLDLKHEQHFTQPPARFNESTLVKELEDKGIGRPSTYAQILSTIRDKGYVEMQERRFHPTDLGVLVNDLLVKNFPQVLDAGFTAQMEAELDHVEEGKREWQDLLKNFYGPFSRSVEKAAEAMENVKTREEPTDLVCERCGAAMIIRWGRNGFFLACSAYPECRNTKEFKRLADGVLEIQEGEKTGEQCPECGAALAIRQGRYGRFVACTKYPECKYTSPVRTGVACPVEGCTGELVEKRSKKGKTFYACNRYPACDHAVWDRPVPEPCPLCGNPFLVAKEGKSGTSLRCPQRRCGYRKGE